MNLKRKLLKERIKRLFIDFGRKIGRLKTPMDIVILWLKTNNYFPKQLVALEPFGMHGLWHTKDYSPYCVYNEIFEIEKSYFNFLKKEFPQFNCRMEDSIQAIKNHNLNRDKYNFIVIDNPYGGIYGNIYCEHFDLFHSVLNYLEEDSILILNFIIDQSNFTGEQIKRRENFYGKTRITAKEAMNFYIKAIELNQDKKVIDSIIIPRNEVIGYLVFVINKR